ncbi:hypothetical protein [Kosakonia oryziphila]|uniref:Uncharacterized protein n=1 Tax=Kosakonia oryziphila TaxID=1005667 RepID=A0A1C3YZR4_9ENTR|nr:hypothetical protein [Kosakonia oryziphila]SCB75585.1 hypothetical protein GA0061070_1001102 [Kosakonia oryziphila]
MGITEDSLLHSGFTHKEIRILKNNIKSFGGDLDEVVHDLAKRFNVLIVILFFFLLSVVFLAIYSSVGKLISGSIGLLITSIILIFIQPPVISYKSWRFCRENKG